jgi:hypothetical protein
MYILTAADTSEDCEQVQADQDQNNQRAVARQGKHYPPVGAGLPQG